MYAFSVFHLDLTVLNQSVADGVVRLYRNYDPVIDQGPVQMVSSFRALQDLLNLSQGSGIITEWRQSGAQLFVGGDSRTIRIWDAHTELIHSVPSIHSPSYISILI